MSTVADTYRALLSLDRMDHEIWAIEQELASVPKAIKAAAAELAVLRSEEVRIAAEVKANRADVGASERALEDIDKRRTRAKKRLADLYTAEQIAATEREIGNLGEQADELEETGLIAMEAGEVLQASHARAVAAIAQAEADAEARVTDWSTRQGLIEGRRASLQGEREPIFTDLRKDVARRYQVGWNSPFYKPPSGVTGADGIICTTCHTALSNKWVQESRRFDTLHACDSCKRILVFDPDAPPPPKPEPEGEPGPKTE